MRLPRDSQFFLGCAWHRAVLLVGVWPCQSLQSRYLLCCDSTESPPLGPEPCYASLGQTSLSSWRTAVINMKFWIRKPSSFAWAPEVSVLPLPWRIVLLSCYKGQLHRDTTCLPHLCFQVVLAVTDWEVSCQYTSLNVWHQRDCLLGDDFLTAREVRKLPVNFAVRPWGEGHVWWL